MMVIRDKLYFSLFFLYVISLSVNAHVYGGFYPPNHPVSFVVDTQSCNRFVDHERDTFQLQLTPYIGAQSTSITTANTRVVFRDYTSSNPGGVSVNMPCFNQNHCNAWADPLDGPVTRFRMNIDQIVIDESQIPPHIINLLHDDRSNEGRNSFVTLSISNGQRCRATYIGGLSPPPIKPPVVHIASSLSRVNFGSVSLASTRMEMSSTIDVVVSGGPLPLGGSIRVALPETEWSKCGMSLFAKSEGLRLYNGAKIPLSAMMNETRRIDLIWIVDPRSVSFATRQCSVPVLFILQLP